MNVLINIVRTLLKVAQYQLKAYYLASIEKNTLVAAETIFDTVLNWTMLTPDWLLPVCSVVAGGVVLVGVVLKIVALIKGVFSKKTKD